MICWTRVRFTSSCFLSFIIHPFFLPLNQSVPRNKTTRPAHVKGPRHSVGNSLFPSSCVLRNYINQGPRWRLKDSVLGLDWTGQSKHPLGYTYTSNQCDSMNPYRLAGTSSTYGSLFFWTTRAAKHFNGVNLTGFTRSCNCWPCNNVSNVSPS